MNVKEFEPILMASIEKFIDAGGKLKANSWGYPKEYKSLIYLRDNCGCALSTLVVEKENVDGTIFSAVKRYCELSEEQILSFTVGFDLKCSDTIINLGEEWFLLGKRIRQICCDKGYMWARAPHW